MQIELVPINSVKPYPLNNRKHSEEQIARIAKSIQEYGFNQPLVIDENNEIIIGHGRLLAALALGYKTVPAKTVKGLTNQQRRAYRILDNKLQNDSEWDFENVEQELDFLKAHDFDLEAWGLDELYSIIPITEPETTEDGFEATEQENIFIKRGDLIELGAHRVMCGSSADETDVKSLMQNQKALLMSTDPPYGVAYTDEARVAAERALGRQQRKEKWLGGIENDQLVDDAIQPFLEDCFRAASQHALIDNAAWYLWHAHLTAAFFAAAAAAAAADVLLHRQIVWVKPSLLFGFGDYHWRHECCFYGWKQGFRPEFYGERNQTSVWEIKHETSNGNRIHPTQKPLELFAIPIKNHTKPGELLYEPFMGSGAQLIAAEQLGRLCYGMEIEPKYCQVIIERYRKHCSDYNKPFECKINGKVHL